MPSIRGGGVARVTLERTKKQVFTALFFAGDLVRDGDPFPTQ
jgi:hypothetical protein